MRARTGPCCILAAMIVLNCPLAAACSKCTSGLIYDKIPFTVFWFYILLLWTGITGAGFFFGRTSLGAYVDRSHFRSACLVLVTTILFAMFGIQLLWLLFAVPIMLLARIRDKSPFVATTSRMLLIIVALCVPVGYLALPFCVGEPQTYSKAHHQKHVLAEVGSVLEDYSSKYGKFPMAGEQNRLDITQLRDVDRNFSPEKLRDVFSYEMLDFAPGELIVFNKSAKRKDVELQYATTSGTALLWSRGPNGKTDIQPHDALTALRTSNPELELSRNCYDPTNGTLSPGDLFLLLPQQEHIMKIP